MNRRRSPRLHPQIQASEEGAGMARRRSPRLLPQNHASEDGAGVTRRRVRRRRGKSPAAPASLPDGDDMLREIFLRLPPQPSSLLRASVVCRRWRGLVTDPRFLRQLYAHHRKPPLLGVFLFLYSINMVVFTPVLDPPDRAPPKRFDLGRCSGSYSYYVLDCRHGFILVKYRMRNEVAVCAPITGEQRCLSIPPEFNSGYVNGAVICAADDLGHVHGGCHSSPFKVVVLRMRRGPTVCVYSSETGTWGDLISTETPCKLGVDACIPATLVGNALYWLSRRDRLLEFHLDGQKLAVIMGPVVSNDFRQACRQIVQADDGAVGFAILSYPRFQMWQRNINCHGAAAWVPWKTIEMDSIPGLPPQIEGETGFKNIIRGYDEDNDVIFLRVNRSVYMVQLKSMQSRKLDGNHLCYSGRYHPFRSFYTPAIRGGDEAGMLHNP